MDLFHVQSPFHFTVDFPDDVKLLACNDRILSVRLNGFEAIDDDRLVEFIVVIRMLLDLYSQLHDLFESVLADEHVLAILD